MPLYAPNCAQARAVSTTSATSRPQNEGGLRDYRALCLRAFNLRSPVLGCVKLEGAQALRRLQQQTSVCSAVRRRQCRSAGLCEA